MNPDVVYAILADVARNEGQITYKGLSERYEEGTQEWHEPHGSWDEVLGKLNVQLHALGWPPLSAVVVLQDAGEPGRHFWGSSLNVPARPGSDEQTLARYVQILRQVHEADWPDAMPLAPPE